ncbi:outer membrane protein OmpA-like peptidoglycan-associated protein [Lipingzhangella halophila]|uniref:Outer membrane protein OmpA-like peptidoglycan-associated protein n=1 Tax=Lipingzhangella halophila TaxID=1783352 RepID=A0A7W7W2E1_9ACTN|nr:OmpA family protein [Lipingzhangella halophila]MBB4930659.1 outer membrane protein OmpA-like peptidoglycan-associated protein [Lipingzhangella halophila]
MDNRIIATSSLVVVLALTSCGLLPGSSGEQEPAPSEEGAEQQDYGDFPYEKEGRIFIEGGDDVNQRLGINGLQSGPEYTVLEIEVTMIDATTGGSRVSSPSRLVDPIDGLAYEQLTDEQGQAFGPYFTEDEDVGTLPVLQNIPQAYRVYFPPLPEYVTHITYTGQGMGAMTGIPVEHVDEISPAEEPNANELIDEETWEPVEDIGEDTTVVYPLHEPEGDFWDAPRQMESMVDDGEIAVTRAGTEETFALNADLAFEFDESELQPEVEDRLTELATYMSENLDAEGPIEITGHTDSVGDDAYNRTLSEERAEAVREIVEPELGESFEIQTDGLGSSEPLIAEEGEDEEAQARNRRVEISQERPFDQVIEDENARHEGILERAGDPAAFNADDGEAEVTLSDGDVELNVYPFVRDGAYVVAVMGFANTGSEPVTPDLSGAATRLPGQPDQFSEGTLGGFQTEDGDGVTHSVVQLNHPEEGYSSFAEEVHELHPGDEYRTIAWFLAPEKDVETLTLQTGAFGDAADVPIRG